MSTYFSPPPPKCFIGFFKFKNANILLNAEKNYIFVNNDNSWNFQYLEVNISPK